MIEKIVSSGIRIALLKKLLLNPESEYYLRELSSGLGYNTMAVRQELKNLVSTGLVAVRSSGNRKYFRINSSHLLFQELKSMIVKTAGIRDILLEHLTSEEEHISISFIYGSIASGTETSESDVDLFVIGDISPRVLSSSIRRASDEIGREINYYVMTVEEFSTKLKDNDHFVGTVMQEPKVFVTGNEEGLRELAK